MLRPVGTVAAHVRRSAGAFGDVVRNRNLRRLELAWTASIVGHWAYLVAVSVYAYEIGGESAVGLIFLLRLVPAALIAPFAGLLADRYPRERVLLFSLVSRVLLISAAAVCVYADVAPAFVYALAVAAALVTTPFRSAQAALTPTLAQSPTELTAANAVASTIESLAAFVGPAVAGVLLGFTSTGTVFLFNVALVVVGTLFVLLLDVPHVDRQRRTEATTIAAEALTGFRTVLGQPALRTLVGLFTAQTFVAGAVQVFVVVTAIELLDLGKEGVGYLNSALGVGALVGGILALSLTGAKRLSPAFIGGIVLWGAPLIVIGLWSNTALAIALFAVLGVGNSFVDVAGFTLVQRAVPDDVLARVFGVIQMLWLGSVGIGAMVAPAIISWLGLENALVVVGAVLPIVVALCARSLVKIDAAAPAPAATELRILSSVPIFAPLPGMTLEHLASRLVPLRVDTGTVVVREGDPGDRFYLLAEGTVEVSEYGRTLSELGPGGYFGEIALIRDVPRTATVTAKTSVVLYALDREDFLAAVTNHEPSAEAAEEVVSARLAGIAVAGARIPTV
jgi:MFS family permease